MAKIHPDDLAVVIPRTTTPSGKGLCRTPTGALCWDSGRSIDVVTQSYPTMAAVPAGFVGAALLNNNNLVIGNGTNIAQIGSGVSNFAPITKVAAIGDSITAGTIQGNSYYNVFIAISGGKYYDCGNFGIAGQRSDQILARINTVIASGANTVFTQFGTNDIGQSIPEATLRANAIAIWTALQSAGIQVIDVSLLPNNTTANVPRFVQHSIWRSLYCRANGIRHLDVYPLLATNNGTFAAGMTVEGKHPTTPAANIMAAALLNFIQTNQYASPVLAYTDTATDNLCHFGNAITFANVSGLPTGWTLVGSGATNTVNGPDSGGFGSWARTTLTALSNVGLHPNNSTLAAMGWNIGDKIFTGCRLRWVDSNQALQNTIEYISPTLIEGQPLYLNTGGATGADFMIQGIGTIAVGSGANIDIRFIANGTGYFEINRPIVVNITQLGL